MCFFFCVVVLFALQTRAQAVDAIHQRNTVKYVSREQFHQRILDGKQKKQKKKEVKDGAPERSDLQKTRHLNYNFVCNY